MFLMCQMSEGKSTKVLCTGDVRGNFVQLHKKVSAVNKKNGPFDLLLCVGEFFGDNDEENQKIINGELEFPIPTYILGPCSPSTSSLYPNESSEFSSNVTYLGKSGILNTATGIQIAYLSGIEGKSSNAFQFNTDDVQNLLIPVKTQSGFLGVDVLLTSIWPAEVWKHAHNTPSKEVDGSNLISRLASALKPRYHFAGNGLHYERQPYRNHRVLQEAAQHTTRFIGLGEVGNPSNEKWLYAFTIQPMRRMKREELTQQPPNASEFPYMDIIQEMLKQDAEKARMVVKPGSDGQFRFDMSEEVEDHVDRGGKRKRNHDDGPRDKRPAQPCWFCLSNVDAEKHLVVSIGQSCYAAMPKGPLVDDHVMVLSIGHIQALVGAPDNVLQEIERFKNAFTLAADKAGKALVCFERNFKSQHLQVQMIPVPKSCVKALKGCFLNAASLANIELSAIEEGETLSDLVNEGCPYFMVELPDRSRLFTRQMRNFPLQFGREVLASRPILDCEDKIDWRAASLTKDKEIELCKALQARFKPFDFTDEDDSD